MWVNTLLNCSNICRPVEIIALNVTDTRGSWSVFGHSMI